MSDPPLRVGIVGLDGHGPVFAGVLNSEDAPLCGMRAVKAMAVPSVMVSDEQLRDNVGATGWRLTGEPLQRLNEVSHLLPRYPESFEYNTWERRRDALDMPSLT